MRRSPYTALIASLALHAAVAAPVLVGREPVIDLSEEEAEAADGAEGLDEEGELPIEELENLSFRVTLYEEPPAVPVAAAVEAVPEPEPPAKPVAAPVEAEVPIALPVPEPPPEPPPPPEPAPPPEPVAEVTPEPAPEPVLTEEEKAALAEMERGDGDADAAPLEDDDGEAAEAPRERPLRVMRWKKAKPVRKDNKPACPPPVVDIARVAEAHWYIDRDLIERYATNLVELKKLGVVWAHKDRATGKPDGFRVGLARCSVLRQGGLKSGDIVHDINGKRINTVLQAVGAYLALRNEPELRVRITRRGEQVVLAYTVEQPQRKGGKKQKKSAQAAR